MSVSITRGLDSEPGCYTFDVREGQCSHFSVGAPPAGQDGDA